MASCDSFFRLREIAFRTQVDQPGRAHGQFPCGEIARRPPQNATRLGVFDLWYDQRHDLSGNFLLQLDQLIRIP